MEGDGPPAAPPEPERAAETRVQQLRRLSTSAMSWAVSASERHLSVALGFRAAERNRRVAAAVLAGGFAYRLFFWLLAVSLVAGGVFGLLGGDSTEQALEKAGIPGAVISTVGQFASDSGSARWWLLGLGLYLMLWSGYTGAKAASLVHALIWERAAREADEADPLRDLVQRCVALDLRDRSRNLVALRHRRAGSCRRRDRPRHPADRALGARLAQASARRGRLEGPAARCPPHGRRLANPPRCNAVVRRPKLDKSSSLYGPLGGVATLLFWMYLAGRLVVTAPILNASLFEERRRKNGETAAPPTDAPG